MAETAAAEESPSAKDVCEGRNLTDEQACLEPGCCHGWILALVPCW
jgi:hypothetical protein